MPKFSAYRQLQIFKSGVVAEACNPSPEEVGVRRQDIPCQLALHRKFEASLLYVRPRYLHYHCHHQEQKKKERKMDTEKKNSGS